MSGYFKARFERGGALQWSRMVGSDDRFVKFLRNQGLSDSAVEAVDRLVRLLQEEQWKDITRQRIVEVATGNVRVVRALAASHPMHRRNDSQQSDVSDDELNVESLSTAIYAWLTVKIMDVETCIPGSLDSAVKNGSFDVPVGDFVNALVDILDSQLEVLEYLNLRQDGQGHDDHCDCMSCETSTAPLTAFQKLQNFSAPEPTHYYVIRCMEKFFLPGDTEGSAEIPALP